MKARPFLVVLLALAALASHAPSAFAQAKASLVLKASGEEMTQKVAVSLKIGTKVVAIKTLNGGKTNYGESVVKPTPKNLVGEVSTWYAGGGEDLYVVRDGKNYVVYHRYVDEGTAIGKFKKIKTIKG